MLSRSSRTCSQSLSRFYGGKRPAKETVMIELTAEQHQALMANAEPVRAVDPATNAEYVLVRAEVYDRFKKFLDEDDARLMYDKLADIDPEDWEDAAHYPRKS